VTIAVLVLAWGAQGIAAPAASPGEKPAPAPAGSSFHDMYMLDADTCLAPQEGVFTPDGFFGGFNAVVRELLLNETGNETVLSVVVQPSFSSPYSLRLEQPRRTDDASKRPRPYALRLVRANGQPWSEMMQEMQRLQGSVIRLAEAEQKRALPAVSRATETKALPVAAGLANRLVAAWAGALARTQYLTEIRDAPNGSHVYVAKMDGTTYDFWHGGRGGTTHSPEEGSLLHDLTDIVETLAGTADAAAAVRPALLAQLDRKLDAFQLRLKRNEPCLRPRPAGSHRGTRE
jgi:hypothetical protein